MCLPVCLLPLPMIPRTSLYRDNPPPRTYPKFFNFDLNVQGSNPPPYRDLLALTIPPPPTTCSIFTWTLLPSTEHVVKLFNLVPISPSRSSSSPYLYGWQTGGVHPTGMLSCFHNLHIKSFTDMSTPCKSRQGSDLLGCNFCFT